MNQDILYNVFVQLGYTPFSYYTRMHARSTCKSFAQLPIILFHKNGQIDLDRNLCQPHCFINLGYALNMLVYDFDDLKWVLTQSRANPCWQQGQGININRTTSYNLFTEKHIMYCPKLQHWIQAFSLSSMLEHSTSKLPSIPLHMSSAINQITYKRGSSPPDYNFSAFLATVCKHLSTHNHHILSLTLRDSCYDSEYKIIADILPTSQIVKLDLSESLHHCFTPILLNGYKLHHLDLSYCSDLTQKESAALLHLIQKSTQLTKLNVMGTHLPTFDEISFDLIIRYCGAFSTKELSASLFYTSLREHQLDLKRVGNLDKLFLTDIELGIEHDGAVEYFIDQTQFTEYLPCISQTEHDTINKLIQCNFSHLYTSQTKISVPRTKISVPRTKISVQEKYKQKNMHRNQLLPETRQCSYCGCTWPAKSIKIQTFEGIQSKCKLGKQKCIQSIHSNLIVSSQSDK